MYSSHKSAVSGSRLGESKGVILRHQKSFLNSCLSFDWSGVKIALRTLGGGVGKLLWERHGYCVITTECQTGRQTESNSPSEKWQKAREGKKKAKCQSGKNEKTQADQRERANRVILSSEGEREREALQANHPDQRLCLWSKGKIQWHKINQHNQFSTFRQ